LHTPDGLKLTYQSGIVVYDDKTDKVEYLKIIARLGLDGREMTGGYGEYHWFKLEIE
jgi:hypothetical protein